MHRATTYNDGIKLIRNNVAETISTTPNRIIRITKIDDQFWVITNNEGIIVLDKNFSFEKSISKYNTIIYKSNKYSLSRSAKKYLDSLK